MNQQSQAQPIGSLRTLRTLKPEMIISVQELHDSVGFTRNSSVLSKTIKFLRTHQNSVQKVTVSKIQNSLEDQRRKIRQTQNKIKQQQIDRELSNKEVLIQVNLKHKNLSETRLKRLEDKLASHQERRVRLKDDATKSKGLLITDLFRQIGEEKDDYIPQPNRSTTVPKGPEEEKGLFTLTEYRKEPKRNKKEAITSSNPFEIYGTKEMWDKIVELSKHNQAVKFPDVGIEKTPIFQLQQDQGTQSNQKNNDFHTRLMKGEFIYKGRINKLNFMNMFEEIDQLKSYKPRIEKVDPVNKNLLSHKLAKAMEAAGQLWGNQSRKNRANSAYSLNSFEKSMENFLEDSKNEPIVVEQGEGKRNRYIFTKQHKKVLLH